jgi:thiopurine S-methyltransferase
MRAQYAARLEALLPEAPRLLVTLEYPQARVSGPPFSVEAAEVELHFGARYSVECLERQDVLDESPRFRDAGLDRLWQCAWRLMPTAWPPRGNASDTLMP